MKRTVYAEDAIAWLRAQTIDPDASYVASLPDISEFSSQSLAEWQQWFINTAALICSRCADQGIAIFYQTDIRFEKTWVDKSFLCLKAAEQAGSPLLFHKIVCRSPAGTITLGRPSYSHLLCFSRELRLENPTATIPDVSSDTGEKTWVRGMGLQTALGIAKFIKANVPTGKVINPFCGEGSMLAAANFVGLEAMGIERSPKRAEKSRHLFIDSDGTRWRQGSSADV